MCQGEASFSYHIYGYYVRIVKRNQFLLSGRAVFHCRYKCLQEKQNPTARKNSFQMIIISENRLRKAVLYYSNFVKEITKRSQKFRTFPFRLSFVLRQKQAVLLHLPHIFSTYNGIISIVERALHAQIQRYFCHKHDAHKRICLSVFFCQYYCNSCSFLLFHLWF